MISIDLFKKFDPHVQMVTGSADVIVTQLLRYHMPLLYCMQPFNFVIKGLKDITKSASALFKSGWQLPKEIRIEEILCWEITM